MKRLRLGKAVLQLHLVWIDEDTLDLEDGPDVAPVTLSMAGLRDMIEKLPDEIARIEATTQAEDTPAETVRIPPAPASRATRAANRNGRGT